MAASKALFLAFVVATVIATASAYEYTVGDGDGWKLKIDYTKWAEGKNFYVGDKLIFKYNTTIHNVMKVNQTDFKDCLPTTNTSNLLTSGHDEITLAAPGKKWYICGFPNHCSEGMKLVIDVSPAANQAPAPAPWSAAPPTSAASEVVASFKYCASVVVATLAVFKMILAA